MHYRKLFLQDVLARIDECDTATDVANSVNILVAIRWVVKAWVAVASYPGPFTRAVRAGKGLVPVVRACVKFYWNPGKIVFFGIF